MRPFRPIAAIAFGVISLTACTTTNGGNDMRRSSSNDAQNSTYGGNAIMAVTEAPDLGALDQFGIPAGQCGMILFTQSNNKPVAVFRSTDDGQGLMEVDGVLRTLTLVGRSGESRQQVPSGQFFRSDALGGRQALGVSVQTRWGASFPGGAYVRDGTLTITAEDGWSRVLPVAGIAGCKG